MKTAFLNAVATTQQAFLFVRLASNLAVDESAGVISGAAVMSIGAAEGHGWYIDQTTLQQTCDAINAMPEGAKIRFDHPEPKPNNPYGNATGSVIGRLKNCRIEGGSVRGDICIGEYARSVPGKGDVRTYVLGMASSDPSAIGLSAVIDFDLEMINGQPTARVYSVSGVDLVDHPAANPRGLLSAQAPGVLPVVNSPVSSKGESMLTPEQKALLVSMGLDPNATPEQTDAFIAALTPDQKTQYAACSAAPAATAAASAAPAPATPAAPAQMAARQGEPQLDIVQLEARRVNSIRSIGQLYAISEEHINRAIASGRSVDECRPELLAALAAKATPVSVRVGQDRNIASLSAGISDAIRLRTGAAIENPSDRAREFRGMTMSEIARAYLSAIGVDTLGRSKVDVCQLVFDRRRLASLASAQLALSNSDFSNILADTIGKTLRQAYDEQPSNWAKCFRRSTAPDFKTISRTQLSESPDLDNILPGEEYQDGKLTDSKETFVLSKYGKIITLTWESLINDDLGAFSRIPQLMGAAARRKEDDVAFFVLLYGTTATMADTGALFNSTAVTTAGGHANYTSSGTAISSTSLNVATAAMGKQVGPQGKAILNLTPKFLIVPKAISGTAWTMINSPTDPASSNASVKNKYATNGGFYPLELIEEARLDLGVTLNGTTAAGSATSWYLASDTNQIDTIEVCFLEDEPAPVITEEDGFRVDGRQYKIRHTVAAKAIDFRGLYKNAGG